MRFIIIKLICLFNKIYYWLNQEDRFGFKRSAKIISISFFAAGVVCKYVDNSDIQRIAAFSFALVLFGVMCFFVFDTDSKFIRFISGKSCNTSRELMKSLSHASYFYGLFWFSSEACIFAEVIIGIMAEIFNGTFVIINFASMLVVSMFTYTFYILHIIFILLVLKRKLKW